MTAARKKLIEDYRKEHPTETCGYPDVAVEAMVFSLESVSTEALAWMLNQRHFHVTLEMG